MTASRSHSFTPPPTPDAATASGRHAHVCPACMIDFVCTDAACAIFGAARLWVCEACRVGLDELLASAPESPREPWEEELYFKERS